MIEDILPRYQETGTGSKKTFTLPFDPISDTYLRVYLGESLTTDYTINEREVTFRTAPGNGVRVTFVRLVPLDWQDPSLGSINSESINNICTIIVAKMQSLEEEISRCVKSDITSEYNSDEILEQLQNAYDILSSSKNLLESLVAEKTTALTELNNVKTQSVNAINSLASSKESEISDYTETEKAGAKREILETKNSVETDISNFAEPIKNEMVTLRDTTRGYKDSAEGFRNESESFKDRCEELVEQVEAPAWGKIVGDISAQTDLQNALNTKANDSNTVHRTGNEEIGGNKTFTQRISSKTNRDSTVIPSTYTESVILQNNDKNEVLNSSLRTAYDTSGNVFALLYAGNKGVNKSIGVGVTSNGSFTTIAPTPTENTTTSIQIDTVGARNTKLLQYRTLIDQNVIDATKQNVSTALNYNHVSNCITEIPQNIKLEINSPYINILPGSTLVIPNGDVYTTATTGSYPGTYQEISGFSPSNKYVVIFWNTGEKNIAVPIEAVFSGDTQPTTTYQKSFWYNTNDKFLYFTTDRGQTWEKSVNGWSFPVCIVEEDSSGNFQFAKDSNGNNLIFNGAGFIGHHAFVLPGVKALLPNGFNDDGGLKSREVTTNSLQIIELLNLSGRSLCFTGSNQIGSIPYTSVKNKDELQKQYIYQYCQETNSTWLWENNAWRDNTIRGQLASYSYDGTTVTDFTIRQPVYLATTEMLDSKVDNKIQKVSTLPVTQESGVLYVIPEE